MLSKRNNQLKHNKKNLDYYFQLNQKLLIEADNIDMNPKIMALKNNYENQINELKKSLAFYKDENYRKDRIILELKTGNINIDDFNTNNKKYLFKNAQKVSKEHFINKENIELKNKINALQEKINKLNKKIKDFEYKEKYNLKNKNNNQVLNRNNIINYDEMKNHIINNKKINNEKNIGNAFNNID
jgi:hypothetical protein